MEQHVVVAPAPAVEEAYGVGEEIALTEHRALGAARGARRVENRGQIVGIPWRDLILRLSFLRALEQRPVPLSAERQHRDAAGHVGKLRLVRRPADEERGLRIPQKVLHLRAGVGGVDGYVDGPQAQAGEVEGDRLRRLFHLDEYPVARRHRQTTQQTGQLRRQSVEVAIGPAAPVGNEQAGTLGVLLKRLHDPLSEGRRHDHRRPENGQLWQPPLWMSRSDRQ